MTNNLTILALLLSTSFGAIIHVTGDDNVLDIVALVNCVLAGNCGEL